MKKFLSVCVCAIFAMSVLAACTSTQSFSFHVTTGDDVTVELTQDDGMFGLKLADDKASCYVTRSDKPIFQTAFLDKDILDSSADELDVISKGTMNGNDYVCYKGDVGKPCYLITIPNSNTVVQILNSGSYADDVVEDAVKQSFFYIGDKAPEREFTSKVVEADHEESTVTTDETTKETSTDTTDEVSTGVQAGGSVAIENTDKTYGSVGDTISYKIGKDIESGSYSVFVVDGDECTVQLTSKDTDMEPVTVSHESLTRGMFLTMEDGDTLTVTNGIVALK